MSADLRDRADQGGVIVNRKCTNATARKRTLSILPAVLEGLTGREIQLRGAQDRRLAWARDMSETTIHHYMKAARRLAADKAARGAVTAELLEHVDQVRAQLDHLEAQLRAVGIVDDG